MGTGTERVQGIGYDERYGNPFYVHYDSDGDTVRYYYEDGGEMVVVRYSRRTTASATYRCAFPRSMR